MPCRGHGFCALGNVGGVSFWVKEEVAEITSPRGQLQKKLRTLHHLDPGMQGRCCASDSQKVWGAKYNIDNSNKHRLIKKKWEFLISESGKGSKGRIPCSPTFAYVWYMQVYSCMQICLHMEWGLGLRLALVTLPYFKIITPHWAWCLPFWLDWLAGQQVPGILPLALELQACVVMPDFLCGCWGYELSTSCLCSKPCSYWAISLAHM